MFRARREILRFSEPSKQDESRVNPAYLRGDAPFGGPRGYIANTQHLVSQIAFALAISFGWFLVSASIALLALTAFAFAHQTACATALGTAPSKSTGIGNRDAGTSAQRPS